MFESPKLERLIPPIEHVRCCANNIIKSTNKPSEFNRPTDTQTESKMPSNTVISDTKRQASIIHFDNSKMNSKSIIARNEIIKSRRRRRPVALMGVIFARPSVTSRSLASYLFAGLIFVALVCGKQVMSSSRQQQQTNSSPFDFVIGVESQSSARSMPLRGQQPNSIPFDPTSYKNIHEAICGHPELREFAQLAEQDGVKEIVSMDKTPLTVFAPVDRSLLDVLAKTKSRSINLVDLAKHHIAQGSVLPDESVKYPQQFSTYSLLSPLYLQQTNERPGRGSPAVFVNNAKILATHLIPIDADNYHTLHIIDQVLEFAYVNKRTQLRTPSALTNGGASSGSSLASNSLRKTAFRRSPFNLDDLLTGANEQSPVYEFYERFGDLQSNSPQVDLYHTRVYRGSQSARIQLGRDQFQFDQLAKLIRQQTQLRGKLYNVNESNSFNTYFLPISTQELENLQENGLNQMVANILEAHVVPDQVLFTRTMSLGVPHASLFDQQQNSHKVGLSLAKTMPTLSLGGQEADQDAEEQAASRKFLTTPLLLQSKNSYVGANVESPAPWPRSGLTSAEILVANIPLSNGVLHLIKRPVLVTEQVNLLDYINDNENQLSDVVNAVGSRSAGQKIAAASEPFGASSPVGVNRFRELLARERQMLSALSMEASMNKTILAPSDEAFSKLRYDLRALVQGDESLIPKHWDPSYRRDLLERLVKRHVILHQTLTCDRIISTINDPTSPQVLTDNGKLLKFFIAPEGSSTDSEDNIQVESDSTRAHLIHKDLIGNNGVLHIIDRVLGEEQETVYSLMKSIVLKYNYSLEEQNLRENQLQSIIQAKIRDTNEMISSQSTTSSSFNSLDHQDYPEAKTQARTSPELLAISRSIGEYLDELAGSNPRQLQLLASSVNISYQLARLTSLADGQIDWNEKFKIPERKFTYFVPSDLAWIKLQQSQPELYKPLMYFLESQQTPPSEAAKTSPEEGVNELQESSRGPVTIMSPHRPSESSQRLRQILDRHLVLNRKLDRKELERLDSLETSSATLRLVEGPAPASSNLHQLTVLGSESATATQPSSAFAALHSIVTGSGSPHVSTTSSSAGRPTFKSLKLGDSASANIVQANEASNGFVYIIDSVLLYPEDTNHIMQTSSTPAISSTMSSLLGGHNSAILDFINNLLSPANAINLSAQFMLALIGTLTLAIAVLLILTLVVVVRRRNQNKLNRHQHLESGLTSSANSGSTSTTKSL